MFFFIAHMASSNSLSHLRLSSIAHHHGGLVTSVKGMSWNGRPYGPTKPVVAKEINHFWTGILGGSNLERRLGCINHWISRFCYFLPPSWKEHESKSKERSSRKIRGENSSPPWYQIILLGPTLDTIKVGGHPESPILRHQKKLHITW